MKNHEDVPQTPGFEMINMHKRLLNSDFYDMAQNTQDQLRRMDEADTLTKKFKRRQIKKLSEKLGNEYVDMPAKLFAFAQIIDEDDMVSDADEIISPERTLQYKGITDFIDEVDISIALRFCDTSQPEVRYVVRLCDIVEFEIANPDEPLKDVIKKFCDDAQNRTLDPDFLTADFDAQSKKLHEICQSVKQIIEPCCDQDSELVVSTSTHYELSMTNEAVDKKTNEDNHKHQITGGFLDVVYAEGMLDCSRVFTCKDDYTIGYGAPCVVLQSATDRNIYLVPLTSICDIGTIDKAA